MIYLDNSATTKPDDDVLKTFTVVNQKFWGNPSSIHSFGGQAEKLLEKARQQIADILDIDGQTIIFTSGGTESNNLAIKGTALQYGRRGKHMITSCIEHPSVRESLEQLKQHGFEITYLSVSRDGLVDISELKKAIRPDTILVSIMHVNNEIGTIQPIAEIGAIIKESSKAFFHVDGVQGFSKVPLNLKKSQIDLYSLSGHKFHGLKGTGILYLRENIQLKSILSGGNQERKLRSGTANVAGAASLAKAMRLANENYDQHLLRMLEINRLLYDGLKKIPEIEMNTPSENNAPHIINFSLPSMNTEVFVRILAEKDIFVSTTSACSSKTKVASQTILNLGKNLAIAESSVRVSLSFATTNEEARIALEAIKESIQKLQAL